MSKSFYNQNKGFTLIELLIVIGIISILSGITITIMNPIQQRNRARDATILAALNQIKFAYNTYNSMYGSFPSNQSCTPCSLGNCTQQAACAAANEIPGAQLYQVLSNNAVANPLIRTWYTVTDVPFEEGGSYNDDMPGVFRYHDPNATSIGGTCVAVRAYTTNYIFIWKPAVSERILYCDYTQFGGTGNVEPANRGCSMLNTSNFRNRGCVEM